MGTRTFQEIYDFCQTNNTYRTYFQIPDSWHIHDLAARKYYYGEIRNGQCRAGTFIYGQSMRQLERFLHGTRQDYYIHLDAATYEEVKLNDAMCTRSTVYVVVHIRKNGVQIGFTHPFRQKQDKWIYFTPRSHRPFTKEGIIAETKTFIDRYVLLPQGRYRDLQTAHRIPKENFIPWYKEYRQEQHRIAECHHEAMIEKYRSSNDLSYEDAYNLLAASGIFFDLNSDEYEKDELTEQFLRMCNY